MVSHWTGYEVRGGVAAGGDDERLGRRVLLRVNGILEDDITASKCKGNSYLYHDANEGRHITKEAK